jgi:5-methylcytosine-specific restriction endonuclease McrA
MKKVCSTCKESKDISQYSQDKRSKDGLQHKCKGCRSLYHQARRDFDNQRNKTYYEKNVARLTKQRQAQRKENAEARSQYNKNHYRSHQETYKAKNHRRRAVEVAASGFFTANEFNSLIRHYGNRCYYCSEVHERNPHADHFIPLAKGGHNSIENIVPACPRCNLAKGIKWPWDFKISERYYPRR